MRDDGYELGLYHNPGFSTETVVIWSWLSLPWRAVHAFKGIKQNSCPMLTGCRGILLQLGCGQVIPVGGKIVPGREPVLRGELSTTRPFLSTAGAQNTDSLIRVGGNR